MSKNIVEYTNDFNDDKMDNRKAVPSILDVKGLIYEVVSYHKDKKTVELSKHYAKNGKDGILSVYYDNGSLHYRVRYKGLKLLDDRGIFYYKNGGIKCDISYKDGKKHGLAKGYYRGGKLAMEILWNEDKAIVGSYYKKSGLKYNMTNEQLVEKSSG